jgi:DNA polymerase III alpha subunit
MKNFTIESREDKTSSKGNKYARMSVKDETGAVTEVSMFSSFPNFATIKVGDSVQGDLKGNEYNGAMTYVLEGAKPASTGQTGAFKGQQIAKAQEVKAEYIKVAQNNTSLAVKIASTMKMSVDITLAQIADDTIVLHDTVAVKNAIKEWRKWLWENWEKSDADYEPFPSNR